MNPSDSKTFPERVVALQLAAETLVASFYGEHEDHLSTTACRGCGRIPIGGHAAHCLVGPVEEALRGLAA